MNQVLQDTNRGTTTYFDMYQYQTQNFYIPYPEDMFLECAQQDDMKILELVFYGYIFLRTGKDNKVVLSLDLLSNETGYIQTGHNKTYNDKFRIIIQKYIETKKVVMVSDTDILKCKNNALFILRTSNDTFITEGHYIRMPLNYYTEILEEGKKRKIKTGFALLLWLKLAKSSHNGSLLIVNQRNRYLFLIGCKDYSKINKCLEMFVKIGALSKDQDYYIKDSQTQTYIKTIPVYVLSCVAGESLGTDLFKRSKNVLSSMYANKDIYTADEINPMKIAYQRKI